MKYAVILLGVFCLAQIAMVYSQGEGGAAKSSSGGGMDPFSRMMMRGRGGRRGLLGRGAGLLAARGGLEMSDLLPLMMMRGMASGGKGGAGGLFGGKGGMQSLLPFMLMGGGMDFGI